MPLHEIINAFLAWLTGQPQEPEPIRIPIEEPVEGEPQRRQRR